MIVPFDDSLRSSTPDEHVHERSFVLRKQKFDWEWQFSLPTRSAQTLQAHLPRVRRLLHIMQAVCDLHDVQQDDKLAGQASLYAVQANTKAIGTTQAQVVDQPKVNTKASTSSSYSPFYEDCSLHDDC